MDRLEYVNPQIGAAYVVIEKADQRIVEGYKYDTGAQALRARIANEPQIYKILDGYLRYHGKVYVPTKEQILRNYVNYQQNNWVELLPMVQFAFNSSTAATTGHSPFYANYGYEPKAYYEPEPDNCPAQAATLKVDQLKELHQELSTDIRFTAYQVAKYYNKTRLSAPTLKEGDKVFVKRQNIRTERPNRKLDHVKWGPFEIEKKLGDTTYRLKLPQNVKLHPTFHVALLEEAHPKVKLWQEKVTTRDRKEYEVERILDCQRQGKQLRYLVKWKDYSNAENTWEPRKNLLPNCQRLLDQFHHQNPTLGRTTNQKGDPQPTNQQESPEGEPQQEVRRVLVIQHIPMPQPPASPSPLST